MEVSIKNEFDNYKDTYSADISNALAFSGKGHDYFTRVKASLLVDLINSLPKKTESSKVLDVGCGHGLIHQYIVNDSAQIYGVDVAEEVIEIAEKKNKKVEYLSYDGNTLPYEDATFGFAFTICVVHHVQPQSRLRFFDELYRVVQPGGYIAIFEHNPLNPVTVRIVNNCDMDRDAVLINSRALSDLLRNSGFEPSQTKYFLFTTFEHQIFRRLDRFLWWLPFGAQYMTVARKNH